MAVEPHGRWAEVKVPTEDGRTCYLNFERQLPRAWTIHISDELLQQAPQAICAALTMALLELRQYDGRADASDA